jgi:hypothetical protein
MSVFQRVDRLPAGKDAGLVSGPGLPRRPLGRGSSALSAGVEQGHLGDWLRQSGHLAEHDFHDMPDGIGGILGPSIALEPSVDEQLKQIEGQGPK